MLQTSPTKDPLGLVVRNLVFLAWACMLAGWVHGSELEEFNGRRVIPGRLLVRLSGEHEHPAANALKGRGLKPGRKFILARAQLWKLPPGLSVERAMAIARATPGVLVVEPDYIRTVSRLPNDPNFANQYALSKMKLPDAWDATVGSSRVIVVVIDTGINYLHPDLSANIYRNVAETPDGTDTDGNGYIDDVSGWDFVGPSLTAPVPDNNPIDVMNHGTRVSGVLGATGNNAIGVAGVCWNVQILPLKIGADDTSGDLSTSAEVEAIDYAVAMGAKIINASYGGSDFSHFELDAIQRAQQAGVLFVAAAGNTNKSIDSAPQYPASHNLANILAVAATDSSDYLTSYSSYGAKAVDLAAPGSYIQTTTGSDSYAYAYGTSFSSPHVAGIAALVRSKHPSIGVYELRTLLMESTDLAPSLIGKTVTGGRANALKAVSARIPWARRFMKELATPADIPDNDPSGLTSTITITEEIAIKGVTVHVEIDHEWIGDVGASLTSPGGIIAELRTPHVDDARGFTLDFDTQWSFRDQASVGDWVLKLWDGGPEDTGKLIAWGMRIHTDCVAEDVNGDGCINMLDLIVTRNALNSSGGYADVNGDGRVNILDLIAVRNKCGTCSSTSGF
ncbi:MAG: hypothetical protein E4H23_10295 [Chrysiogenales bacterium]|nr:MAG: hypothetical protein E4H23_10295 [Chrysiogenales bacterium]